MKEYFLATIYNKDDSVDSIRLVLAEFQEQAEQIVWDYLKPDDDRLKEFPSLFKNWKDNYSVEVTSALQ